MSRSIWDLYTYDYWYKFWVRVHVRSHHMDVQRMYQKMRKKEFDDMMEKNLIHEKYPQFGNAITEEDLVVEVMHSEVYFGKRVKVIFHPKYFRDVFGKEKSRQITKQGDYVFGIPYETSTLVDTYILDFYEKE